MFSSPRSLTQCRWPRLFVLLSFLVGCLIAARVLIPAIIQYRVLSAIEGIGGRIEYEAATARCLSDNVSGWWQRLFGSVRSIDLKGCAADDSVIIMLTRIPCIQQLELSGTNVSDAALTYVSVMEGLRSLSLRRTRITDDGVMRLRGLRQLRSLDLSGCQRLTNKALCLLSTSKLSHLALRETNIGDAGVSWLCRRVSLRELDLRGVSELTDDGIEPLLESRTIEVVDISYTEVSDAMLLRLENVPSIRMVTCIRKIGRDL